MRVVRTRHGTNRVRKPIVTMEPPVLDDPKIFPDDMVLARVLGRAKRAWDSFQSELREQVDGTIVEWRYYKDGKAWLGKAVHGKKTLAWISVARSSFRVTFYFTAKNERALLELALSPDALERYHSRESVGKLKPMVFEVSSQRSVSEILMVAKAKLTCT